MQTTVPADLIALDQWVLWKTMSRDGKQTKVPYSVTGTEAKSNDSTTWTSFEHVTLSVDGYDGVGFVFTADDEFCGIDLDGCRDPETGAIAQWAQFWIDIFNSYTEISPSKTGVKIFVRGTSPRSTGKNKKLPDEQGAGGKSAGVELYDRLRYFAVTGQRLDGLSHAIEPRQEVINEFADCYFPEHHAQQYSPPIETPNENPLDVMSRARKYVEKMPPAISGQGGHNQTFTVTCRLVKGFGLSESEAFAVLCEYNQRCEPPWSEQELRHKIEDAIQQEGPVGQLRDSRPEGLIDPKSEILPHLDPSSNGDGATAGSEDDLDGPIETGDPWPSELDNAAYHGLIGNITSAIAPHSEADPVAIVVQALVAFGNVIGRTAFFRAEADQHYGNLFACLVGTTSKGRKGSSWGQTRRLVEPIDDQWTSNCIQGGLSSGEGLIWAVRDPVTKREPIYEGSGHNKQIVSYEDKVIDDGVSDKRLLVVESEFSSVLKNASRQTNTLLAIMRQAWDTGSLRTLTKNSPAKATGAHISIIGHITRDELRRLITETDLANGVANRILWLCVRRSQCLPEGGSMDQHDLLSLVQALHEAVEFGRGIGQMDRDESAREIWHGVYPSLSSGRPGLLGAATSRAEAQVMRLAMLYALLDLSPLIRAEHLLAGLAVWTYAEQSARYIFGGALGDPTADEILSELRHRHPAGMTRNDIRNFFQRNKKADEITRALGVLLEYHFIRFETQETGGRPAEVFFARF